MQLTIQRTLSDGRLVLELCFAYGSAYLDEIVEALTRRFAGSIDRRHNSPSGLWLEGSLLATQCHIVREPEGRTWLVAASIGGNQTLQLIDDEIQATLGRVGGYDRRWPGEQTESELMWDVEEALIRAAMSSFE